MRLFLTVFLLCAAVGMICPAEENEDGEETRTEEPSDMPESYYLPIQSNESPGWPQGPAVAASSAIVMDIDTGTVLYAKGIREKRYPASITKIMTAMVALENCSDLDKVFVCPPEVFDIESDSSHVGAAPGEEFTMRQALQGLMLESANDLAMAIAVEIAGSVSGFADMMNAKAASLGCVNTHFVNPHGLYDDDHYVCAYDMALIARAAYENPEFRKLCSSTLIEMPATNMTEEPRYFSNHHRMLQSTSDYYRDWCTGGKTGYTMVALNTLVTYGEKNGLRLLCVVLAVPGLDYSYQNTIDLLEYGFNNFETQTLVKEVEAPTFYDILGFKHPDPNGVIYLSEKMNQKILEQDGPGIVLLPKNPDWTMVSISSSLNQESSSSGEVQSVSGYFRYLYGDRYVGSGKVRFTALPVGITLPFEQKRDMAPIIEFAKETKKTRAVQEEAAWMWQHIFDLFRNARKTLEGYLNTNYMAVVLSGAFILLILVIMIIIVVRRCSRDSRMKRRRMVEARQRRKREEEIDAKTAAEIEEELREAMRQEEERRRREELRMEERIAEEAKLREAEQVLEEISRQEPSD